MDDRQFRSAGERPYMWVATNGPHGGLINVRLQPDEEGRWIATGLLIEGGRITADILRAIQPARLEAIMTLAASFAEFPIKEGPDDHLTLGEIRHQVHSIGPGLPFAPQRTPLRRPDGSDPESFYREVADAYRSVASESQRPAAILAEEAEVPVTTVHRWIREARRRGFLPPGRKGTAG